MTRGGEKTLRRVRTATRRAGRGTHYRGSSAERRALAAFIKLLRAAHWASAKAGQRREEAGLTEGQFGVLEALFHLGPLDQKELGAKVLSSPGNLTLVVDNLAREGYVERHTDESDRRRRVVHMTPTGRRRVESLLPAHVGRIVQVMSGLTGREQEHLSSLCRKLGHWAASLS